MNANCDPILEMAVSQQQLKEMFERNKDLALKNVHLASPAQSMAFLAVPTGVVERSGMAIRDTTDQAKLNKAERAYWEHLKQSQLLGGCILWIGVQNITLKLADDTRYTPDFWTLEAGGQLVAREVKGFFRDDAKVKIKVAARLFPWAKFIIVRRSGYGWNEEEVKS